MARRRAQPPSTPFGAWLAQWFEDHPAVTHAAFAQDVGVSKGLISQWIGGDVKRITAPNLRRVAERTGEPLDNLERMLYGAGTRRNEEPGELDPRVVAAIEAAVSRAFDRLADRLAERLATALPARPGDQEDDRQPDPPPARRPRRSTSRRAPAG